MKRAWRALLLPPLAFAVLLALAWTVVGCSAPAATRTPTILPTASPTAADGAKDTSGPVSAIPDGPQRDLFDVARRYRGVHAEPIPFGQLFPGEPVGATASFWVLDDPGPAVRLSQAELLYGGTHALWYVEAGLQVSLEDLILTAQQFDEQTYPSVMATFGGGLVLPGRITILATKLSGVGGYFTSVDHLPTTVEPTSNERAMLYVNGRIPIKSQEFLGTVAHELQHLVHALVDPDEDTWVNEGLSVFASLSGGYPTVPARVYFQTPETSIVHWPTEIEASAPSYAGASLFIQYLASRTGGLASIHELVAEPADGMRGIQAYLDRTTSGLGFREVLGDWMVANYLGAASGPYGYPGQQGTLQVAHQLSGPGTLAASVPQFGAWYVVLTPNLPLQVQFQGASATPLLPVTPFSGESCWWSNSGDTLDATLTRTLDLTAVPSATLSFRSWHQIEEGFDYGYVAVSTDGGATWMAQAGRYTRSDDPGRRSLGPGYTGESDGWVQEQIDLSRYAGRTVLLRFEYLTDEAISSDGWCIDDIAIPEIGLVDGAESDGDWESQGFMRLPAHGVAQEFMLRLIGGHGQRAAVEPVSLDADNRATLTITSPAVLVVTAIAPKTRQPAGFTLEVTALETEQ